MIDFIKKYKTIILSVLGVFAAVAALTTTGLDDQIVDAAKTFVNSVTTETPVVAQ